MVLCWPTALTVSLGKFTHSRQLKSSNAEIGLLRRKIQPGENVAPGIRENSRWSVRRFTKID
jgi:hypothetical protein